MDSNGFQWILMDFNGFEQIQMDIIIVSITMNILPYFDQKSNQSNKQEILVFLWVFPAATARHSPESLAVAAGFHHLMDSNGF